MIVFTSSALSELDGSLDIGALAEMLAGGHEYNIQQEQRVCRMWLHEVQLYRRSVKNRVIEACILEIKHAIKRPLSVSIR